MVVKEFWHGRHIPVDEVVHSEQAMSDEAEWDTKSENSVSFRKPAVCGDKLIPAPPSILNDTAHSKKLNKFLACIQKGTLTLEVMVGTRRSELHKKFEGARTNPTGNIAPDMPTLIRKVPQHNPCAMNGRFTKLAATTNVKPDIYSPILSETTQSGFSSRCTSSSSEDAESLELEVSPQQNQPVALGIPSF